MPIASARWLACFVAVLALQMPSVAFSRDFVLTIGGGYSPQGNQEGYDGQRHFRKHRVGQERPRSLALTPQAGE